MKTKNLFGILMLFLFTFAFISCDKEDEEGTKVTNYQEYELTVASKKVLGMIFSEGNNYFRKVYAVKKTMLKTGYRSLLFKTSTTKKVMNIT